MKTIHVFCHVCRMNVYMRITLIGQFWMLARCDKCRNEFRYDKNVDIIEQD